MFQHIIYIITFIFLFQLSVLNAQDYMMAVVSLEQDEELIGNRVSAAIQDKEGFVWMLTQNGLTRYDGHHYLWFNKTNSELRDIPKPKQIAEDGDGYIWLNHETKIDLLHRSTFEVVHFEEKFRDNISGEFNCRKIEQGFDGSIFISLNHQEGIKTYIYRPEIGIEELKFIDKLRVGNIKAQKNSFWCVSNNSWVKYDLNTGKKLKFFKRNERYKDVKAILGNNTKDYFSGFDKNDDLVIFEALKKGFRELTKISNISKQELSKNDRIYYHTNSKVFISLIKRKVSVIDLEEGKLIPYKIYSKNRETIE